MMKNWGENVLLENMVIKHCKQQSLEFVGGLQNLMSLEIRNCWKLETFKRLNKFRGLRKLVLWDCPQLQLESPSDSGETRLPPSLQSLVVHGCHHMLSLHVLINHPSSLTELEVTDCKQLMYIGGLHKLINLETLAIMQCPRLLLEPLHAVPDCVVISGCPRLRAWCEMHSIEPLGNEILQLVIPFS
jgi:hypothetical protein